MKTTFEVGDVFPPNKPNKALMQFWLATRHSLALQRALLAKNAPKEVEHEQFLHIFLAIAATLSEAAKAFRCVDGHKCFKTLPNELSDHLATARRECDKSQGTSLYSRFLNPLRNTIGAHFDQDSLARGLSDLASQTLPLCIGGKTFFDSTYPLATALTEKILEFHGVTYQQAEHEFPKIINLGRSLQALADAVVTDTIKTAQSQPKR
jgi:hypothetical protein